MKTKIKCIYLYPPNDAPIVPDIIIVEDDPEKPMWIAPSYLHTTDGKRIESTTAILQATCVDSTIILPQKSHKPDLWLLRLQRRHRPIRK